MGRQRSRTRFRFVESRRLGRIAKSFSFAFSRFSGTDTNKLATSKAIQGVPAYFVSSRSTQVLRFLRNVGGTNPKRQTNPKCLTARLSEMCSVVDFRHTEKEIPHSVTRKHLSETQNFLSETQNFLSESQNFLSETQNPLSETRIRFTVAPFCLTETPSCHSEMPSWRDRMMA